MKLVANYLRMVALAALLAPVCLRLPAADAPEASPLVGTWKWSFTMSDGSRIEPKAKIKREGDAWKGTSITRPGFDTAFTNIVLQGDNVSWIVHREQDGRKVTTRYHGKLKGDTIKGKVETDRDGQTRSRDWEAKREAS